MNLQELRARIDNSKRSGSELGIDEYVIENLVLVAEAAKETLQAHLDDYGHGTVEQWGPELENELGWGECGLFRLGRALAPFLRANP